MLYSTLKNTALKISYSYNPQNIFIYKLQVIKSIIRITLKSSKL